MFDVTRHQNALLTDYRCGRCAEEVAPMLVLRAKECTRCGSSLAWQPVPDGHESTLEAVEGRWRTKAIFVYILVGVAGLIGAHFPLVHSAVVVFSMVIVSLWLLRPALGWLSGMRQLLTRIAMRLILAVTACIHLFFDVLLIPLPVVRTIVLSVLGIAALLGYVELSLKLLGSRLRQEKAAAPLTPFEVGLPLGVVALLLGTVFGTGLALSGALWLLRDVQILGIGEFARFLLGGDSLWN